MSSKKKKKQSHRYINDMIDESKGRKREILLRLRELNKEAWLIMHSSYFNFKTKYRFLQKQACWKEGKRLLLEYFTYDNILICPVCNEVVDSRRCVIHHVEYKQDELMTPFFIRVIHARCHEKIHQIEEN